MGSIYPVLKWLLSLFNLESVSSVEGSRNRRRRKKKKIRYHVESSNASDDNYKSSGFSEPSTQASSDRSHNSSYQNASEPCTNGEDSKVVKNGSDHLTSKQSRDLQHSRSHLSSVPNKAETSTSKETAVVNGSP